MQLLLVCVCMPEWSADDSAALASFLLDDKESSWVTGQIIGVDGGRSTIRK